MLEMNSTPQQQKMQPPYIGSKISLISKLDIRYEGTLYTVDPIESTIALAKVHSYGTEDRRTPVFVPPRDEIYDFIIFKASDIKDLIVCEQPKASSPNSVAGLPYDPAIVSISKNPPPEPKLPHKLNMMNAIGGLTPNNVGHVGDKLGPGTRQSFEQLMAMGGPSPLRFPNYRHPTPQYQLAQQRLKNTGVPSAEGPPPVFDKDYDFEEANQQFREKIIEDQKGDIEEEEQKSVKENADTAVEENAVDENNANKQKEEHAMADNEQQKQQAAEFYNKTLSFFDNISCDALEKAAGNVRPDWKRERQTNQETFGHNAVRNLFYQQRRGTRGYSGAGCGGAGIARYNNNYRFPPIYQQGRF